MKTKHPKRGGRFILVKTPEEIEHMMPGIAIWASANESTSDALKKWKKERVVSQ